MVTIRLDLLGQVATEAVGRNITANEFAIPKPGVEAMLNDEKRA